MRAIVTILGMLFAGASSAVAQDQQGGVAGTWEVEDTPFSIVLEVKADAVGGMLVLGPNKFIISDGSVNGDRVVFRVSSPDGARTVTFTGNRQGDQIRFTRDVQLREGAPPGGAGLMGLNGPPEFRARRASPASEVWNGTIRNAPTPRNQTPNPNPRPVSLSTRKMPDPHWRWRGGDKEIDVRMFALPNQSMVVTAFDQLGDRLAFSLTLGNGTDVTCTLSRQSDGRFDGRCQGSGGGFNQLIELMPPGSDPPPAMR